MKRKSFNIIRSSLATESSVFRDGEIELNSESNWGKWKVLEYNTFCIFGKHQQHRWENVFMYWKYYRNFLFFFSYSPDESEVVVLRKNVLYKYQVYLYTNSMTKPKSGVVVYFCFVDTKRRRGVVCTERKIPEKWEKISVSLGENEWKSKHVVSFGKCAGKFGELYLPYIHIKWFGKEPTMQYV